jgi:hypothetical protein
MKQQFRIKVPGMKRPLYFRDEMTARQAWDTYLGSVAECRAMKSDGTGFEWIGLFR